MQRLSVSDSAAIEQALTVIGAGGLILFPTDTVYGIGTALSLSAVEGLYVAKDRPADKTLPVLMGSPDDWQRVAARFPPLARRLADAFWPGALTLVVPALPHVAEALGSAQGTVGLRVPNHEPLRAILSATGPLATSSANRSGEPPARDANAAARALPNADLVLDGGPSSDAPPSTVVGVTSDPPRILREGAISANQIAACVVHHDLA